MVQCPDRIIASMDTGVDDALALAYLLGSADECELGGVIARLWQCGCEHGLCQYLRGA